MVRIKILDYGTNECITEIIQNCVRLKTVPNGYVIEPIRGTPQDTVLWTEENLADSSIPPRPPVKSLIGMEFSQDGKIYRVASVKNTKAGIQLKMEPWVDDTAHTK